MILRTVAIATVFARVNKNGAEGFRPVFVDAVILLRLQELSHKKLADLLRTFDRRAVDYQDGDRLGAGQLDQFFFMLRVVPNIFLHDLLFAMKVGHTVEYALRKAALVVEIKLHRHNF